MKRALLLTFVILLLAVSCRSTASRAHYPKSIAVLPLYNETIDIDAPKLVYPMIVQALEDKDYYVVPPLLVLEMLAEVKNVREGGQMNAYSVKELGDLLHADTLLMVTLTDWSTKYLVVASTVTVAATFRLVDVKSGALLWETSVTRAKGSGARSDSLLKMVVDATANALFTQYATLAEEMVDTAFSRMPLGPFFAGDDKRFRFLDPAPE
jgi:hypothetical protein